MHSRARETTERHNHTMPPSTAVSPAPFPSPRVCLSRKANSEWYGLYKKLRAALASLPADGPSDGGNIAAALREGTASVRRDYDPSLALTPAASESLVTLTRATEHLLAAKESAPGVGAGGFDVTAAEACRKVRTVNSRMMIRGPFFFSPWR